MMPTSPIPRPGILIVDDDVTVREAVAAALCDGYQVHTAGCGAEAIALLQTHNIALIILDAFLGFERGLDLVPHFRRIRPAPILLLTAYGSVDLLAQALRLKVDDYQEKPISLQALRAAVDHLAAPILPSPGLAARARKCLEQYPPKPLDLTALAGELSVSEVYLRRVFRMAYGKTPRRYALECRVQRAAQLLQTTTDRVECIAADTGFPSSTLLERAFRVLMGTTPTEYRVRMRGRPA